MKTIKITLLFLLTLISPAYALDPSAPKLINLQAVVVDEGGNVIYNTQEDEVTFQIVDVTGTVHYEEVQQVVFVKGAMSVLVGSGNNPSTGQATGGIPAEALTPDGTRLLRYKLNSQAIPQEDLELASVPYSYYAQYALEIANPIESDEIQDGTIETADLSQALLDYLNNSIAGITEQDLQEHRTERGAHTARAIIVDNSFVYASGSDLQTVLEGFDNAISLQDQRVDLVENRINNLAGAVTDINNIPGVLNETKIDPRISRNGHNHDADYVNVGGDTMAGNLDMAGNEINGPVGEWTEAPIGWTLNDHEDRLDILETQDPITENDIPQPIRPFAYGRVYSTGGGSGIIRRCEAGYNITASAADRFTNPFCNFTNNPSGTNYQVIFSSGGLCDSALAIPATCYVTTKNTDNFEYSCNCGVSASGTGNIDLDFIVYYNP